MTDLLMPTPTDDQRLLGEAPRTPVPRLSLVQLIALTEAAGLTGRGGAGFPTARKLASITGRRPVVIANAMEGEPLSSKDAVLLQRSPGLVVDGLCLVGAVLGARRTVLATGPEVPSAAATEAAHGTGVEVLDLGGGFVAGQESALVSQVEGGPAVPRDPLVPVFTKGVGRRPTLVLNAETLAQLALVARYGADWFRQLGSPGDTGTFLVTLTGSTPSLLTRPGVLEVPRGTALRHVLRSGGVRPDRVQAVLVGGYHGAWVPGDALDVGLSQAPLSRFGATPGAGVVHALDRDLCPIAYCAGIAAYLAAESTRQCGPCLNGLPRMADSLRRLAVPGARQGLAEEVARLGALADGRGACAHPDGTVRFVASTLRTFADHVSEHIEGRCHARAR